MRPDQCRSQQWPAALTPQRRQVLHDLMQMIERQAAEFARQRSNAHPIASRTPREQHQNAKREISGRKLVWRLEAWSWFQMAGFWWMHAMVLVWLVFTLMLCVIEPLFLEDGALTCSRGDRWA